MKILLTKKEITGIIIAGLFFVIAQYFAIHYAEPIKNLVGTQPISIGIIIYSLIAILAIVVAPISSLPLVQLQPQLGEFLQQL